MGEGPDLRVLFAAEIVCVFSWALTAELLALLAALVAGLGLLLAVLRP